MTPPATSPSPFSSAMPRRISGPTWMRATSPRRTGTPASVVVSGIVRKSSSDLQVAARRAPCTRPRPARAPSRRSPVGVAAAPSTTVRMRDVVARAAGPGRARPGTGAPCRRRVATSATFGHGLQLVLEEPVLQRAQLRRGRACRCDRPARTRRSSRRRSHPGRATASPRRQARLHLVQVFEHARARPVRIGAVLEQHVDERIAEERIAAHGLRARHRQHRRGRADR